MPPEPFEHVGLDGRSDPMQAGSRVSVWAFVAGAAITFVLLRIPHRGAQALAATQPSDDVVSLRAEIERLKGMVPDQSHVMADVGYHYANLWFAARAGNWPLADFYASETKSHLRWAVRIIPVRKDAAGRDVDLKSILDAIETSALKDVQDAVTAKDPKRFEAAYGVMLQSCISCHQASAKPYLRPHIPDGADAHILDFKPQDGGK
jgi:hypothetical protein